MNLLRRLLIGSDENIEQRNMIWNMIGSFLYAFASMMLTIAVIQVVGEDQGRGFYLRLYDLWAAHVHGGLFWHQAFSHHRHQTEIHLWRIPAAAVYHLRGGPGFWPFVCGCSRRDLYQREIAGCIPYGSLQGYRRLCRCL